MSIITTHKGITRLIQDETKIQGTNCKQCQQEMDALAFALGGETCFSCLEKKRKE